MTIASGAVMTTGTSNGGTTRWKIGSGPSGTIFLPGETFLFQNSAVAGDWSEVDASLTGPGSLVVTGAGRLYIDSATGANTFSGGLVVNSGDQVLFQNNGQLGTGTITLNGGAIDSNAANTIVSNPVNLNGAFSFGGNGNHNNVIFTGPVTLTGNAFIDTTNTTTLSGVVSGSGTLALTSGAGALILSNANTYTGGTFLTGGILEVSDNNGLGTGALTVTGGSFAPRDTALALSNTLNLANVTLTIASATTQGENLAFTGPVNLIGSNTIADADTGPVTFSGLISGTGALTLNTAAAILLFQGANTFSGGLTITAGSLVIGNSTVTNSGVIVSGPLGTGTIGLSGGSVFAQTPGSVTPSSFTFANPVVLNGTTIVSGTSAITLTGTVTMLASSQLTVNDTAGLTISGAVLDSNGARALTVAGTGMLTMPNPSLYSGGTVLNAGAATGAGILAVGNNALGVNAVQTLTFGGTVTGGTFTLTFDGQTTAPIAFSTTLTTLQSNIASALAALSIIGSTSNVGVVASGSTSAPLVTVTFLGTLAGSPWPTMEAISSLTSTTPTLATATAVAGVAAPGASLGTGAITLTAGVLQANAPFTQLGTGAVTITGPVAFTGSAITLNGAVTQNAATLLLNNLTTLNGAVTAGANALTLSSTPLPTVNGFLTGTGNLVLTNTDNTTSTITVNAGSLTLNGNGNLSAITGVTVNTGGTVSLDNTVVNNTTRILNTAPVTLNGGTLNFLGNNSVASSQTFTGTLNVASGNSTVNVSNGTGQTATLTFGSLTRTAGATVNYTAGVGQTLGSSSQILFTTNPTTITFNGVLQGATTTDATAGGSGTGFNLANYNAATGVVAQTVYTTLPTSGTGSTTTNYIATTSTALAGNFSANALLVAGSGITVSAPANSTLTLGSATQAGTLAVTGGTGNVISVPTVAMGTAEGLVLTNSGSTVTVSSAITGTAGLTLGGAGTVTLSSSTSSYSGTTTLNSGTLAVGAINAIPTTSTSLSLIGGTIQAATTFLANTTLTLANVVTFNNSTVVLGGPNPLIFSGIVTLNGTNNLLTVPGATGGNAGTVTFSDQIINGATAGNLSKLGAGTLFLTNALGAASTYTGQTTIAGGILNAQNAQSGVSAPLGVSANVVVASGASLQLQGLQSVANGAAAPGITFSRPLFLYGSGARTPTAPWKVFSASARSAPRR